MMRQTIYQIVIDIIMVIDDSFFFCIVESANVNQTFPPADNVDVLLLWTI